MIGGSIEKCCIYLQFDFERSVKTLLVISEKHNTRTLELKPHMSGMRHWPKETLNNPPENAKHIALALICTIKTSRR